MRKTQRSALLAIVMIAVSASSASAAVTVTRTGTSIVITGPSAGGDLYVSADNPHRLSISDWDGGVVTAGSGCDAAGSAQVECDTGGPPFTALTVDFSLAIADTDLTLYSGILTSGGVATVTFGSGDDGFTSFGSTSTIVHGGAGDDYLYGGDGTDALYGEAGEDSLVGSDGADVLDGGADADFIRASVSQVSSDDPDASISCGPGDDSAWTDFVDPEPSDCEELAPGLKSEPVVAGTPNVGNTLTVIVPEVYRVTEPPSVSWYSGATASTMSSPAGEGPTLYLSKALEGRYVAPQLGLTQTRGINAWKTWSYYMDSRLVGPGTEPPPPASAPRPTVTVPVPVPSIQPPAPAPNRTFAQLAQADATAKLGVSASALSALKLPNGCLGYQRGDAIRGRGLAYRRSALKAVAVGCDRAFTLKARWTIYYTPQKRHAKRTSLTTRTRTYRRTSTGAVAVPLKLTGRQLRRLRSARNVKARVTLTVSAGAAHDTTARQTFPLKLRR